MLRITVFIMFLSCASAGSGVLPMIDDVDYPEEEPTEIEFVSDAASIVDLGLEMYSGLPQHPEMTILDPAIFAGGMPSIPLFPVNLAQMLSKSMGLNEFPSRKNEANKSKIGAKKKHQVQQAYNSIIEMVDKLSKLKY